MATSVTARLQDFGTRSLLTHAIMAVALAGAVASGLVVEGELGRISFVALLNFTAGVWVCQSIHSIGNPEYKGVINVVRGNGD